MIKEKFIPLTNDLLFKEVLTNPLNRDILIDFLETFTELPKKVISDHLEVKQQEPLEKENLYNKGMIGDILIKFNNYIVNIEMYSVFNKESITKSICYNMRIFSNQLSIGEKYSNLSKVIQINIIDKVNTNFNNSFKSEYVLANTKDVNDNLLKDKFIFKCYRVDKAKEDLYNESREHRWIKFIGAKSFEERKSIAKGDKILMKTEDFIDKYILDSETTEIFASWRKKIYQDEYRKEAIREGSKETKIKIAKTMNIEGYSFDEIKKITKLSQTELEKILKESN